MKLRRHGSDSRIKEKGEVRIKSHDLAVRENERILQRNKELQKHLLINEKRQEEIYDLKYEIQ